MRAHQRRFLQQVYDALRRDSNGFTCDGYVAIADADGPKVAAKEIVQYIPLTVDIEPYLQRKLRRAFPETKGFFMVEAMEGGIAYHIPTEEEGAKARELRDAMNRFLR